MIKQPKTKEAARRLYGAGYDPSRCIHAVETFQCGHPATKGKQSLYCWRHVK